MIEVETALELITRHFVKCEKECVPLKRLGGRILAAPLRGQREHPPFDRVAMDGVALSYPFDRPLRIEGIQRAGIPPLRLSGPQHAIEVMTGAILPTGADTVVAYEYVSIEGGVATLKKGYTPRRGQNIHVRGSDYPRGTILLDAGTKLNAASVALIAGQGKTTAIVSKLPGVAVVSSGDELKDPGEKCEAWQIPRSNSYGIYSELARFGYSDLNLGLFHVQDKEQDILTTLSKLLRDYPLLIISGGVSMGKYDFIPKALEELGIKKILHKVKQRPGKPLYFGVGKAGQNVFGLPGNPVSALVCMRRYISAALQEALGGHLRKKYAVLSEDIRFEKDFSLFQAVSTEAQENGPLWARPISSNGSGDFLGLGRSDGFLQLPSHKTLYKKGEHYPYFSWTEI